MMSRQRITIAFLIGVTAHCGLAEANEPVQLPTEPHAAVVEMWYVHAAPPSHPEVIILADGRMQIMSPEGPQRAELPVRQLHQLMTDLLFVDGLSNVETSTIRQRVQEATLQSGLSSTIEGAGETVFRIRTATESREIRCPAVGILAVRFPEIHGVRAMAAAQRRLENLKAVTSVGGSHEAQLIANMAAEGVQSEYGVDLPVSKDDLSMVRALPDGSRFCQFVIAQNQADSSSLQMISITETPGHRPVVHMIGDAVVR